MKVKYRFDVDALVSEFSAQFSERKCVYEKGRHVFPNGVSQYGRFTQPFPVFISSAHGTSLTTVDGLRLVDFWQGHFSAILGHNPPKILNALEQHPNMFFQLGCNTELEQEVAFKLCRHTRSDQAILCTTGAQATMLAILVGLTHTKRKMVLKIRGGWHGVQPWSVIDVASTNHSSSVIECAGVPESFLNETVTVPFNDPEKLASAFLKYGDKIGVVIAELVLGNAGMEMASINFARALREQCDRFGSILVLDEIVTGFRTSFGPLSDAYGIKPEIATFGKAICGGMPFAAIVGRADVLASIRKTNSPRVMADAGTFTAHPATLRAVLETLKCLEADGDQLYPCLLEQADTLRKGLSSLFHRFDVPAHVTGGSPDPSIPGFPIMTARFLADSDRYDPRLTMNHWDSTVVDTVLRDTYTRLALAIRGVFAWQGAGVVTTAHSKQDIEIILHAYEDWLNTWSSRSDSVGGPKND